MDNELAARISHRRAILAGIKAELIERLQLDWSPDDLDDDTYLFGAGLQLDSIDAMEIIIGMQLRFGVDIPEGDMSALRTLNTLADFVEKNVAAMAA
jgi:acyl carrier protein